MSDREKQFEEMVAEFPDSPMAYFSLGKVYLENRKYTQAVKVLEEALKLDPDYAAAMVALGDAYTGVGDTAQAIKVLKQARSTALGQSHQTMADEVDDRLRELEQG